jgi:hypothetical protein
MIYVRITLTLVMIVNTTSNSMDVVDKKVIVLTDRTVSYVWRVLIRVLYMSPVFYDLRLDRTLQSS